LDGAVAAPGGGAGAVEPGRAGSEPGPEAARGVDAEAEVGTAAGVGTGDDTREGSAKAARWIAPLAAVCGLVLVAATVEIVLDAALEHSPLIPHQPHLSGWLASLGGERLGYRVFLIALLASSVAYVILLCCGGGGGGG
jgi:hypothetical protein